MYSLFRPTICCHLSGNFIISSSPNVLPFEQRTVPGAFCSLPGNCNFFPSGEFCKDRNKWKSKGSVSGENSKWIRTSQPSCNSFCLVIKETCSFALSWWKIMHFCWLILDAFHQALLSLVWLGAGLVGISHLVFQKELKIGDSLPIPPFTHHLLWLKTSLWCGCWWFILLAPQSLPFHIMVKYPLFTSYNLF